MLSRLLTGLAVLLVSLSTHAATRPGTPAGGTVLYVSMEVIGPGGRGDDCGALDDSSITANVGDHVHVCWFGLNNTAIDLTVHSISDTLDGDIFTDFDLDIPPTQMQLLADFRITVKQTVDITETWTAYATAGGNPVTATATTHIEALRPTLGLGSLILSATAAAGEVAHGTIGLSNSGTGELAWHFGEADMPGEALGTPQHWNSTLEATLPSGASVAPAYAVQIAGDGNHAVLLDMYRPQDPTVLPGTLPDAISAGAFIDDDYSRELLLSDTSGLIAVDTTTGAVDTINAATAPDPGDAGWLAMAWDPLDRTLYALSTNGTLPSLYAIDPATGATARLGEINDRTLTINGIYTALAADSDGRLFAIDETNDLLVAVARDAYSLDGRVSGYTVGPLGIDVETISALAFDAATNALFLSATPVGGVGTMYAVDTVTGAATAIGTIGAGESYVAMSAVASARPCGLAGDVAWLSLDTYIDPPLPAGAGQTIGIIFDATDLDPGEYDAKLCLHTNDATQRKLPLPVHLTVGANRDGIFGASFEGGAP